MKKFLRWLYVRLPKKIRIWANSIRAARMLRAGKGLAHGQLGVKIYRGLGYKAAELAGVPFDEFMALPADRRDYLTELAKKTMTAEHPATGVNGDNTVTDAGVGAMVDDWADNSKDISAFNYHAMGTGGSPPGTPAVTLTALTTEVETRSSGTKSQPQANQIRTVATIMASAARSINEWGLFDAASSGVMWSTRWFTAIALGDGDGIEFTYTLTIQSFTA